MAAKPIEIDPSNGEDYFKSLLLKCIAHYPKLTAKRDGFDLGLASQDVFALLAEGEDLIRFEIRSRLLEYYNHNNFIVFIHPEYHFKSYPIEGTKEFESKYYISYKVSHYVEGTKKLYFEILATVSEKGNTIKEVNDSKTKEQKEIYQIYHDTILILFGDHYEM